MKNNKSKTLCIRLNDNTKEEIERIANEKNIKLSELVRIILEEYISNLDKK